MKRDTLQDAMARRSPLTPREPVEPVDLYANAGIPKPTSGQNDKTDDKQVDELSSALDNKHDDHHVDMLKSGQMRSVQSMHRRYTTYLRPETIKAIKRLAVDEERNDYEVVQEALDKYLQRTQG